MERARTVKAVEVPKRLFNLPTLFFENLLSTLNTLLPKFGILGYILTLQSLDDQFPNLALEAGRFLTLPIKSH